MVSIPIGVIAAACSSSSGGNGLSGNIEIDGSSTVFPITQALAEDFRVDNSGVQIAVGVSGTGGGFRRFVTGDTDISDASRPIKASEATEAAENGVEYIQLSVAFDGITVAVHPDNDFVTCLTTGELETIWQTGSTIDNWNQVRESFPDEPIRLYGPGTDSGTFDYFTEAINGEGGASRADYTPSEDDNVLVQGISGDRSALGYFGFAYYIENTDRLKALAIDNGNGCVEPTEQTINDGTYAPLSRPIFIYVNTESLSEPHVRAFVEYYLENAADIVGEVGYVPLPDADYQEGLDKLG